MSGDLPSCPESESESDAALLRLYADTRSDAAFATLVRRYVNLVYSTAVRCVAGDVHLARDVTQEVFVVVARRAGALSGHCALEGWLYTTTRYEAAHAVRREQRRRAREQKAQLMNELHENATPEPDWQQLGPLLDQAMGVLSARDREAVVMRFFLHRSFREISERLGLKEDAARRRVDRALEKLHQVLAQRGVASTATAIGGLLSTQAVDAAPAGLAELVTRTALETSSRAIAAGWSVNAIKLVFSVGAVALVVLLGVGSRELRARRTVENRLAVVERESTSRLAAERDGRERRDPEEQPAASLVRNRAVTLATPPAAASRQPPTDGGAFLERHPDLRWALIERSNAKLNYRWAALHRELDLKPAQIARFQALMREGETYRTGPDSKGRPLSFYLGTGLPRNEIETQVRDLLGKDGMRRLQEYSATIPAREQIIPLAGVLHVTAAPLTADQAELLVQILTQNRSKPQGAQIARFEWNAAMTAAAEVLSAPQLAAFDSVRAHDLVQLALGGARLSQALPRPDMALGTTFTDSLQPSADSPKTPTTHPLEILHRDPGVQVLWLASRRALVAATYGPLLRALALTPSQIETFQAITIRREEQAMDLTATMRTQALAYDDSSVVALRQTTDDEERAARLALLGPQGYRELQEYLRTLPIREWIGALAGVAAVSGAPFSAETTSRLIPLFAGASRDYVSGGTANLASIDWQVTDRLARTVLSAEQFAIYETVEPEGHGGRFSSRVAQALERARKLEAAAVGEN